MLFDSTDSMKASAENAFNVYIAPRGDSENEYTYLTEELGFSNSDILTALPQIEERAKCIVEKADDKTCVGHRSSIFEAMSAYMETSDAFDSEEDYLKYIVPYVLDMLLIFEAFVGIK